MYVIPVDTSEMCTIINGMKESSAGWDSIHSKIVKSTYNLYLDILTRVLNLSITREIFFRGSLKWLNLLHFFKSQTSMMFNNHRPVSILPVFSTILEKLIYNIILFFLSISTSCCLNISSGFEKSTAQILLSLFFWIRLCHKSMWGKLRLGYFWI